MPTPSFIRPVQVSETSPFLGDRCALCKEAFVAEDRLVICPQDGSRHHLACWQANGNRCTAYGCDGYGQVLTERRNAAVRPSAGPVIPSREGGRFSKVRTLPSSNFGCAQTCLVMSIALAIVLIAAGCFGLWAIADYVLVEVLEWPYRTPFTGVLIPSVLTSFLDIFKALALL
jgi:Prokaryotic RING finger family 1